MQNNQVVYFLVGMVFGALGLKCLGGVSSQPTNVNSVSAPDLKLVQLTKEYAAAFNSKNIDTVSLYLHSDCVLIENGKEIASGKSSVVNKMKDIFKSSPAGDAELSFKVLQVGSMVSSSSLTTFMEFEAGPNRSVIGTDVLTWGCTQDMSSCTLKKIVAYFTVLR
eukprot:PhF_6_TR18238/c0_g1_i1/m.26985